jgi:hypothetical protein
MKKPVVPRWRETTRFLPPPARSTAASPWGRLLPVCTRHPLRWRPSRRPSSAVVPASRPAGRPPRWCPSRRPSHRWPRGPLLLPAVAWAPLPPAWPSPLRRPASYRRMVRRAGTDEASSASALPPTDRVVGGRPVSRSKQGRCGDRVAVKRRPADQYGAPRSFPGGASFV